MTKNTLSYNDKICIRDMMNCIAEHKLKNKSSFYSISPFSTVFHELGHIRHKYNIGIEKCLTLPEYKFGQNTSEMSKELQEFLKHKDEIVNYFGQYAATKPGEFVAEMFAGQLAGKNYSQELMDLYAKWGGPAIKKCM